MTAKIRVIFYGAMRRPIELTEGRHYTFASDRLIKLNFTPSKKESVKVFLEAQDE